MARPQLIRAAAQPLRIGAAAASWRRPVAGLCFANLAPSRPAGLRQLLRPRRPLSTSAAPGPKPASVAAPAPKPLAPAPAAGVSMFQVGGGIVLVAGVGGAGYYVQWRGQMQEAAAERAVPVQMKEPDLIPPDEFRCEREWSRPALRCQVFACVALLCQGRSWSCPCTVRVRAARLPSPAFPPPP